MRVIVLPTLFALLLNWVYSAPLLTSVDADAVPIGDTMTFTGSGFSGTTKASFFSRGFETDASFSAVSDTTLEVTLPSSSQDAFENFILVETANGSTVSVHDPGDSTGGNPGPVVEFVGTGALTSNSFSQGKFAIVKAGAVATSVSGANGLSVAFEFIYVESGAVIQNIAPNVAAMIFAEDGATLDFRGTDFPSFHLPPPSIFYSPGTTILGTPPAPRPPVPITGGTSRGTIVRQIPSLSISPDVGSFSKAVDIDVNIVGDGTVATVPAEPYVRTNTPVTLTATPGSGSIFSHWSGTSNSTEPSIELNSRYSGITITANFHSNLRLEIFASTGGSVTTDPPGSTHPLGSVVGLTATPDPGFEFVRWGGELAGGADASASLTMDTNKIVSAVFQPLTAPILPQLSTVDSDAIPFGQHITFSGSGLAGTTRVSFLRTRGHFETTFTAVSDDTLEVVYPASAIAGREHFILVEAAAGSTVSLHDPTASANPSLVREFDGFGQLTRSGGNFVIVNPGAVATSVSGGNLFGNVEFLYVRRGGVVQHLPPNFNGAVFAEDGATLDFRDTDIAHSQSFSIFYSPNTTILGMLPIHSPPDYIVRQLPPISLSRNIGSFTNGVTMNVSVNGGGTVTVDPDNLNFRPGRAVSLTAVPADGSVFATWSGASNSTEPVIQLDVGNSDFSITANFDNGFDLETYFGTGGSISIDPDLETYAIGQVVNFVASSEPGYVFGGWGGDLDGETSTTINLTMDSNKIVSGYFKPAEDPVLPKLDSVDGAVLPVGETLTFTGSELADTSKVSFFADGGGETPANFNAVSDSTLEVTLPDVGPRGNYVLLEATGGSTVSFSSIAGTNPIDFQGYGPLDGFYTRSVVVKSGAIVTTILSSLFTGYEFIYVEKGAVMLQIPRNFDGIIFAEDGATLNFRNVDYSSDTLVDPSIIYSPGTILLGTLPSSATGAIVRQVPSFSLSRDVGSFAVGCALDLEINGPGTVTVDPAKNYYRSGESVQVRSLRFQMRIRSSSDGQGC